MCDVNQILSQVEQGDPVAAKQLSPLVQEKLCTPASTAISHKQPARTRNLDKKVTLELAHAAYGTKRNR
jgi:hypothetical protein